MASTFIMASTTPHRHRVHRHRCFHGLSGRKMHGGAEELTKSKDVGVAAAAKEALETPCVAAVLLITAREHLDGVSKARTAASAEPQMARRCPRYRSRMPEVLRAALEAADAAGVAQSSHMLEGGAPCTEVVEGARVWLCEVGGARVSGRVSTSRDTMALRRRTLSLGLGEHRPCDTRRLTA